MKELEMKEEDLEGMETDGSNLNLLTGCSWDNNGNAGER